MDPNLEGLNLNAPQKRKLIFDGSKTYNTKYVEGRLHFDNEATDLDTTLLPEPGSFYIQYDTAGFLFVTIISLLVVCMAVLFTGDITPDSWKAVLTYMGIIGVIATLAAYYSSRPNLDSDSKSK